MAYNREGYAPWSLTRKAGVQSATVNGDIEVPQYVQPVLDTGFVDEKGDWKGTKSSDESFFVSDTAEAIANTATTLFPNTANADFIDMTGFEDVFIALKVTNAGNYKIGAVMGPNSNPFANLRPVHPATLLRGYPVGDDPSDMSALVDDASESLGTVDVWFVFNILGRVKNQKNLQFSIQNNSGDISSIDFAYMRMV
jgi:hypothetical protein